VVGVNKGATITIDSTGGPVLVQAVRSGAPVFSVQVAKSGYIDTDGRFTTPATLTVYFQSAQPGESRGAITLQATNNSVTVPVTFDATSAPSNPPQIAHIVNAASGLPAALAPDEIVSIFGLGVGSSVDPNATTLLINGFRAPLLYTSAGQVNAIIPIETATSGIAKVNVTVAGVTSPEWAVPLAPAAPAVFTLDGTGTGPAAVLNQDSSVNSDSNPAARGSVIQIFATGIPTANLPVKVAIGGFDAPIQYQGPAPGLVSGVQQINAIMPSEVPPVNGVPLVIAFGDGTSPRTVTVAVK
jgi:uncharacterized protein (TIGR03437 family)